MSDLSAFVQPDETALQLYARNYVEPLQTGIFFCPSILPGQVLEVCGRSGSGKTTFLLQAVLAAVLPSSIGGAEIGGHQEHVLFIDLDQKFDILRIMEMLHARIQPILAAHNRSDDELDAVINDCLQRFHLISCSSSFELLATLKTISPIIDDLKERGNTHLLCIDNISSFYWMDFSVKAQPKDQGQAASEMTLQAVQTAAASALKGLAKQLRLAVLVSKHCFKSLSYSENDEPDYWQHKEMMCKSWTEIVSQRMFLRRMDEDPASSRQGFLAKWDKPSGNQIFPYLLVEAGICPATEQM